MTELVIIRELRKVNEEIRKYVSTKPLSPFENPKGLSKEDAAEFGGLRNRQIELEAELTSLRDQRSTASQL